MSGPIHSWNFRPSLVRGGRALIGLAILVTAATAWSPRFTPSAVADAVTPPDATGPELAADSRAWPRTALHLWILVPQILPRHDR